MGYEGGQLADWASRGKEGVRLAGRHMADTGGRRMTEITKANTPVGEDFDQRGSALGQDFRHLRNEIQQKEVISTSAGWESGTETDVIYALYVEHGTGLWGPKHAKYIIKPKDPNGVLAFFARAKTPEGAPVLTSSGTIAHGGLVFAKYVMHPGSPGQHMFAIGAQMVEHEVQQIGQEGLQILEDYMDAEDFKVAA